MSSFDLNFFKKFPCFGAWLAFKLLLLLLLASWRLREEFEQELAEDGEAIDEEESDEDDDDGILARLCDPFVVIDW